MKRAVKDRGEVGKSRKKSDNLDIYELSETGNSILNLSLQYPNMTNREMGIKLNLNEDYISRVKKTPAYQNAYKQSNYEARRIILESKTKAAEVFKQLLESENEKIKLDAAAKILGDVLDPKSINLMINKEKLKKEIEDTFE